MRYRLARAGTLAAALAGLVLAIPSPAAAQSGASIAVSPPAASPGQLRFYLSGAGLEGPANGWTGNITVTVDGTALPVKTEPAGEVPRTDLPSRALVLAIDTSAAMAGTPLPGAIAAGNGLVDALPADVAVGLVAFSDTPRTVVTPTYDRAAVHTALGALTASGGSAPRDGIRQATDLASNGYVQRRIAVLAAGADTKSTTTAEQALAQLRSTGTVLDLVEYGKAVSTPALAELATGSGGQALTGGGASAANLTTTMTGLAGRFAAPLKVTATVPGTLAGRASSAVVAVSAGTTSASATVPVQFAADPAASPAASASASPGGSASPASPAGSQLTKVTVRGLPRVVLFTAMGLTGLAVAVAVFVGMNLLLGRSAIRRRLLEIGRFTGAGSSQATSDQPAEGSALMRAALSISDKAVQRRGRGAIEQSLDRAALALRPAEWMLLRAVITIVASGVLLLLLPWYFAILLGGLGGWIGTGKYLSIRAGRRARKFGDLLPEALNLVVGALRSGFSLLQSIDAVVKEGPEPVAGEFGRAMAEIRLGGDLEDALERTAERNASEDLGWLVMAIRIQREVGGNLSEVLETAVETMRERGRLARHVRALSAEGRLSAYVLTGMPVVLTGFLFIFRGEYLRPMYTEFLGILMLIGAAILLAAGAFVISRMVKVEV